MDKKPALKLPTGVTLREYGTSQRLQIAFTWLGDACRELLPPCPITKGSIAYAGNLRAEIKRKIKEGTYRYSEYFPDSPRATRTGKGTTLLENLLEKQEAIYKARVENGSMSLSSLKGYQKAIYGARMKRWHGVQVHDVTPGALREWIGEMENTSKTIRNVLVPLRSVFDDALNDGLILANPFGQMALKKIIRETAKASDYEVNPYTRAEREQLLAACRSDERPMVQFWFETGLRPGELQAVMWEHVDFKACTVRIELNQVAGVIKAPKTKAGIRSVDLSDEAIEALLLQRPHSAAAGKRIWLNPSSREPWNTDAQIRKTLWQPLCKRAGVDYRNPYQVRHTYASSRLTAGANPWYLAEQLGHETVEMVFRHYGRFIRDDWQKPRAELRLVS